MQILGERLLCISSVVDQGDPFLFQAQIILNTGGIRPALKSELTLYRCPFHSKFVETILSKLMDPPYFPVRYSGIKAKMEYLGAFSSEFEIGSVIVTPIQINFYIHDKNDS
ncbi:MAG: hypothetical protein JRF31_10320 [Deltaproteobacteria bacterium]|nr:hypothetical protein [Deltaproteobacteria bacterium]